MRRWKAFPPHCDDCHKDRAVPFSCKGRGFCPSCGGRRMADTAAHLVDRVFPEVPVRQRERDSNLPGGISLPVDVYVRINEAVVDSMVRNGFKNVVLMADHGRGQQELKDLADQLDRRYAKQGAHVYFCGDVYAKANTDFDEWLKKNGYPTGGHASISDTSEMLYLGGSGWVRQNRIALGDPVPVPGQQPDPKAPRLNKGVTGDPRRSSSELGKRIFDLRVNYAVEQIQSSIAATK